MSHHPPNLLVVDDEIFNLEIIAAQLDGCGYHIVTAENGTEAWHKLQAAPNFFDAVLLDRMMPDMDGIEVLKRIKGDPQLQLLPVILQTAAISPDEVATGLHEGAYYYLTKPFAPAVLREVVATAIRDNDIYRNALLDLSNLKLATQFLEEATFTFRNRDQAKLILPMLSCVCPNPQAASMGLIELMLNAIEHGNLGITYDEKTQLLNDFQLEEEIQRRLALPKYAEREACVKLRRFSNNITFTIIDEGDGFNWENFLEMSPERIMDNHGRGIAMARRIAFAQIAYRGKGNVVEATVAL